MSDLITYKEQLDTIRTSSKNLKMKIEKEQKEAISPILDLVDEYINTTFSEEGTFRIITKYHIIERYRKNYYSFYRYKGLFNKFFLNLRLKMSGDPKKCRDLQVKNYSSHGSYNIKELNYENFGYIQESVNFVVSLMKKEIDKRNEELYMLEAQKDFIDSLMVME
jgi:hypothetical protein